MSQRDTDADWQVISKSEPYYAVLTSPSFLRANLTDEALGDFFQSGAADIEWIVHHVQRVFDASFHPSHAIDFGCGVGRHSFAMTRYADEVTGVDISPAMLTLAEEGRSRFNLNSVEFHTTIPDKTAQWVHSCIVFQHIPPERGYGLLKELLDRLAPGGIASIQLTTHRNRAHLAGSLDDIGLCRFDGRILEVIAPADDMKIGDMRMYDYDLGRVLPIFTATGIHTVWMHHIDHAGHHAFWIIGQKQGP